MPSLRPLKIFCIAAVLLLSTTLCTAMPHQQASQPPQTPISKYDPSIFQKPVPADQLTFLNQFNGVKSGDALQDKQLRKLVHDLIPNCMFHYGRDMPLSDALDMVLSKSPQLVTIRDGRYFMAAGRSGPYLGGRGFIWIDLQQGIVLGGFYFHPTNGEPTPTVAVFSRQVKEKSISISRLPPEFTRDLNQWTDDNRIPPITTRYFITGSNRRILLEHDEDYCTSADGTTAPAGNACEQMMADASDLDMNTAYYLEQVDYATNATAWMITGPEQVAWVQTRNSACGGGPDPLGCHIRMTREHIHVIVNRPSMGHGGRR
jgi:uncharacterized protein YecT (DUF1311 family)